MVYTATDKEQIDEIKKWWSDWGQALFIAILIGLLIGFGWRYWNGYKEKRNTNASFLYQQMLMAQAQKRDGVAQQYVKQLQSHYAVTGYATLASFVQARLAVSKKDYKNANTQLEWVIKNGKTNTLKQIARIRDAKVLMQLNQNKAALAVLATVTDKSYQPLIDVLKKQLAKT